MDKNKDHCLVKMCILAQLMLETIDEFEETKTFNTNVNNLKHQTYRYNVSLLKTLDSSIEALYKKDDEMVLSISKGLEKRISKLSKLPLDEMVYIDEIKK